MKNIKIVRPLTNESIAEAVETVKDFLNGGSCAQKDIVRLTLSVEEALLTLAKGLGESGNFSIRCMRLMKTYTVTIAAEGKNVMKRFDTDDDDDGVLLKILLSTGDVRPEYGYENGINKVKFEIKGQSRLSLTQKSLLAIAIGGAFGILARFLPGTIGVDIGERIVTPIFSTLVGVIAALASIMVFLTVTQSIYLIGDKNTFRKIGGKFFKNTLGKMMLLSILSTLACVLIFRSGTGGGGQTDPFQIMDLILQIVPTNIVSPFLNGNILQILFLAACLGILILLLGDDANVVKQFIDQCGNIVNHMMEYVLRLIPCLIVMSVFKFLTGNELSSLESILKMLIVCIVFTVVTVLWNILFTCIRGKKNILGFIKDTLPAVLMAFTTVSSSAALPVSMEVCEQKLGIDKKLTAFGMPMSMAVFKLGAVVNRVALAFGLAEMYGVVVTPMWIITCIMLAFCLSLAGPAVPSGGLSVMMLLLTPLCIPTEALALAIVYDMMTDRITTVCNCWCSVTELVNIADELKMIKK